MKPAPTSARSKLLSIKEWLTIDEAARHLSTLFGEEVNKADIFQLALEKRLTLSIRLVVDVPAKRVCFERLEDTHFSIVPMLWAPAWNGSPLPEGGVTPADVKHLPEDVLEALRTRALMLLPHGTLHGDDQLLVVDDKVCYLRGLCDLPMIGAEALDIESRYQEETAGPPLDWMYLGGPFVEQDGVYYQLQEEFESGESHNGSVKQLNEINARIESEGLDAQAAKALLDRHKEFSKKRYEKFLRDKGFRREYWPAGHLPDDATLVMRTSALLDFERQVNNPPTVAATTIKPREETTYLNIVGALVELLLGNTPSGRRNSVYESQAAIIDALVELHPAKAGLTVRTLQEKFAQARR